MSQLLEAINAAIDARLLELGLVVAEEPAAPAKGAKGSKKAPPPAEEPEAEEITAESLKAKAVQVINTHGREHMQAILKKFKVAKLSDLKEAKFEAMNTALDEALGEGSEATEDEGDLL